jgi:AcrR family transcriptional regulator
MIDQTTLEGKVIIAAFDLAASPGWAEVSLRDIADAAGCPLSDVMDLFSDKSDVLKVFAAQVDRAMLASAGDIEREQSPRDAVFEAIMSRFDLMMPYKAGLKSIVAASPRLIPSDPQAVRAALATQNKILQAAGISTAGAPALVRQLGLARIYDQVFRIWLDDNDAGMARTMAALDKRLRQGERSLRTIDELARSSERLCEQAVGIASRIFSAATGARQQDGERHDASGEQPSTAPNDDGHEHTPPSPGSSPAV